MGFKHYYPNIIDNIQHNKIYCDICNKIFDKINSSGILFSVKGLTTNDITAICNYQRHPRISNNLLIKAINAFGEIPKCSLYRGLSQKQIENINEFAQCKLKYVSSFSSDWVQASNFADTDDYIMTIQSCAIKLFDLSYFIKVIEQVIADFNMYIIYEKYRSNDLDMDTDWFGDLVKTYIDVDYNNPNDKLLSYEYNRDVNEFRVSEGILYDEQEWLVPANTVLADVDREKLIFKII